MKKILYIFLVLVSAAAKGQAPNINHPSFWGTFHARARAPLDTFHLQDTRSFDYVVQDKFGQKWLYTLPSINATYWNNKLDSVHVSNDSVYDCVAGICTLRGVISVSGGSPGGSSTQVQFNNAGSFAGTSAATADATHVFIPTLYGASTSGGDLLLDPSSNATKGVIYIGGDHTSKYDPTNHLLTINRSANATNFNNGLVLTDTVAATAGSTIQNAPSLEFDGAGWGTTAGTSQAVKWRLSGQSTTSSVAGGQFNIQSSLNGAAFTTPFLVDNSGNVTAGGNLILGTGSTFIKAGSNFKMSVGGSSTTIYSQPSSSIQFDWVGDNTYALWNENGSLVTDSVANQQTANSSALLELRSSKRPLIPPRWTNAQRTGLANVIKGAIAVDTTKNKLIYGNGSSYSNIPREDTANIWLGAQDFTGATITATTQSPGDNSTKGATTAYVDAAVSAVNINKFSQTADGTVSNTTSTTSIIGTGSGTQTIAANTLSVGKLIIVKGFGYLSTDASVPTLTITFTNSSSNVGNAVGALLSSSMNNTPLEWEYAGTVRSIGSGGTIELNGWISINGTKAYIATNTAFAFNTTVTQTFDVTALWGTASANNIIVSKQTSISVQ